MEIQGNIKNLMWYKVVTIDGAIIDIQDNKLIFNFLKELNEGPRRWNDVMDAVYYKYAPVYRMIIHEAINEFIRDNPSVIIRNRGC